MGDCLSISRLRDLQSCELQSCESQLTLASVKRWAGQGRAGQGRPGQHKTGLIHCCGKTAWCPWEKQMALSTQMCSETQVCNTSTHKGAWDFGQKSHSLINVTKTHPCLHTRANSMNAIQLKCCEIQRDPVPNQGLLLRWLSVHSL